MNCPEHTNGYLKINFVNYIARCWSYCWSYCRSYCRSYCWSYCYGVQCAEAPMNNNYLPTKKEEEGKSDFNEDDPGLIFQLADHNKVHACLALPSVTTISPPLAQGKRKISVYCIFTSRFCRSYTCSISTKHISMARRSCHLVEPGGRSCHGSKIPKAERPLSPFVTGAGQRVQGEDPRPPPTVGFRRNSSKLNDRDRGGGGRRRRREVPVHERSQDWPVQGPPIDKKITIIYYCNVHIIIAMYFNVHIIIAMYN